MRTEGTSRINKLLWPSLALGLLVGFNLLLTPGFADLKVIDGHLYGSLIDILNRGAPVLLLSIGMTLVIATTGVDLSVGALLAVSGSIAATILTRTHLPLFLVILLPLAATALAGLWNGFLVGTIGIQPIVATLILMVAGRGIAQLITGGQIPTFEREGFEFIGGGFFLGLPFPITIVLLLFVFTLVLARSTALGLFIESVGENPTASRYAGVQARRIRLFVYAWSGFCAGIAGLIVTSDIKAADANNAGLYLELDAILAVVVGGTALSGGRFFLVGSLIGALIIQTLTTTILTRGVPVEYTLVVKALVVVAVCLVQSPRFREALLPGLWRART